jgi:hypothetical protein
MKARFMYATECWLLTTASKCRHFAFLFALCLSVATCGIPSSDVQAATLGKYKTITSSAVGDGSFLPEPDGHGGISGGNYFGEGEDPELGSLIYKGRLALTPIGDPSNGLSAFENEGRGTDQEVLHEVIYGDGSTISTRFKGEVQLVPVVGKEGFFTAQWTGIWEIVEGTGRFLGAKGQFEVEATNQPFNPQADFFWNFTWSWDGLIKVPKRRFFRNRCIQLKLTANGHGKFDPANLGLGDPEIFGPLIIGDGSGEGIYDGTPTGNDFRLNGFLIGNGWDQHFGNAQSISPGVPQPSGKVRFPGVSGENPDGSGRKIHIMKTLLGEIWFTNQYYFELDPEAGDKGTIMARADFRIVGGTFFFRRALGSVYVTTFSDLAKDFDPGNSDQEIPPSANFRYDFGGFVEFCLR